jgi:ankyrin repeat protein
MPALVMAMSLSGFAHHRQNSEKITHYLIDLIVGYRETDLLRFASIPDRLGRTSLHVACQNGLLDIAKRLIEDCECDPSSEDIEGLTPLHYAIDFDHDQIVDYFLSRYGA